MFCGNCGTQVNDNESICPYCGNSMFGETPEMNQVGSEKQKISPKMVGILATAIAAMLVVVVVIVCVLFSGGYKGAVKKHMKALSKGNTEKMIALEMPKKVWEEVCDEAYDKKPEKVVSIFEKRDKAFWEALKEEGKVKFTYEIKKSESLDKLDKLEDEVEDQYYVDDLDEFKDYLDDRYDDFGLDADKIKKAYAVEVTYRLEVDGDKAAHDTAVCIVYKYEGKWYISNGITIYDLVYELDDDEYEDVIEEYEKEEDKVIEKLYD